MKTLHALEEEIVKSHFVVHIIGGEPGWSPPVDQVEAFLDRHQGFAERFPAVAPAARAGQLSATQWEAWLALYFGKRLYGYELPDRLVGGSSQKLHSERLHEAHEQPKTVANEEVLFDEVLGSLIERGLVTKEQTERELAPSRITKHSPKILFGRDHWLDALDAAWANSRLNVYTLVAWGGVGKTSLVAHWVTERMEAKGWRDVERYFDWSFYSQGTGESRQTSSDLFIQEALQFFDDPDPTKGSPWERGERLAGLIRKYRTLLVLDGIEPLQYPVNDPQAGRLKDQALEALLQSLAADNPGLCVVTTREHLKNIENRATTEEQNLDRLVKEAAIDLLRHLQIAGTEAEMEAVWKDAGGHALTLQLLGRFLADAHGGDIRHYKEVKFEEADTERQGRSAFKVMIAYERWLQSAGPERQRELALLRLTGLFDRPMSRDCLQALRRVGDSRPDRHAGHAERPGVEHRPEAAWRRRSSDRDAGSHRRPSADPRVLRQTASRHAARRVPGRPLAAVRSLMREDASPPRYARWPATALPGRRPRLPRRATAGGVRPGLSRPHPARHGERWLSRHEETWSDRGRSRGGGGVLRRALVPRLRESHQGRSGLDADRGRV